MDQRPQKIERFEDLVAWQKARLLTKSVYQTTKNNTFGKDFGLSNQIQRASVSVMSNIAEGFERGNIGDYSRFVAIAKASCGEVRSQLYVAFDVGYLQTDEFNALLVQTEEVSRVISGLMTSINRRRNS